ILIGAIDEARVFTVGLEQVAPFRLNPLHVEEGVHVSVHIDLLVASFLAAWPVHGVLANYLRRVITKTYTSHGWDVVNNVRGAEITVEHLWHEGERFAKSLRYGGEMQMDFNGAILGRIEDFFEPARAAIFNTTESVSMEDLLSVPTIIELKHIGDPDFRAFMLSLLLVRIYEHFDKQGPSDKLRNLFFIDEAHTVLEEIPRAADSNDVASARRKTADQITDMIAESRSLGLGVGIADQNALRLSRDALKVCNTKIIHQNTSEADRRLLASETGCNEEQTKQIDVLRIGEVIMRGPDDTVPVNVQVFHDPDTYPEMKRPWSNDDVHERMKSFYARYPELKHTPRPPVLPKDDDVEESVSHAVQVEDVVTGSSFREQYLDAIKDHEAEDQSLFEEIIAYYASHITEGTPAALDAAMLIAERASELYGKVSYNLDWALVRKLIGGHAEEVMDRDNREI
ncbi:MAG: ATP-binding protein, partial [Candidatus Thorarchaeota archaeon]